MLVNDGAKIAKKGLHSQESIEIIFLGTKYRFDYQTIAKNNKIFPVFLLA